MTSQTEVTVIAPCFNHADFVYEALLSVANQKNVSLDLVIIDDASHDNSVEIIENFIRNNQSKAIRNISFIAHKENVGAVKSLNEGIALASTPWIAIINTDDKYKENRLEKMLCAAKNSDARLFFSRICLIDSQNAPVDPELSEEISEHATSFYQDWPIINGAFLKHQIAVSTGNLLFRKEDFDSLGGFRAFPICHDWDLLLRYAVSAKIELIDEPLYEYRWHNSNTIRTSEAKNHQDSVAVLERFVVETCLEGKTDLLKIGSCKNWHLPSIGALKSALRMAGHSHILGRCLGANT